MVLFAFAELATSQPARSDHAQPGDLNDGTVTIQDERDTPLYCAISDPPGLAPAAEWTEFVSGVADGDRFELPFYADDASLLHARILAEQRLEEIGIAALLDKWEKGKWREKAWALAAPAMWTDPDRRQSKSMLEICIPGGLSYIRYWVSFDRASGRYLGLAYMVCEF